MGQGIAGGEHGEGQGRANGLFEAACVAQGAHQPVMRLHMTLVGGDRFTKRRGSRNGIALRQKIEAALADGIRSRHVRGSHASRIRQQEARVAVREEGDFLVRFPLKPEQAACSLAAPAAVFARRGCGTAHRKWVSSEDRAAASFPVPHLRMTLQALAFDIETLLKQSEALHRHLCPRQVLGVRMGLLAARLLAVKTPQTGKRVLAMVETDGCFADGVSVATGCSMGHRTMRLADYGKIAATFIDTHQGRALRIAPLPDLRARAAAGVPHAGNRWRAYLEAYQQLPEGEMFAVREVTLNFDLKAVIGRPGSRELCAQCGEEIVNQREVAVVGRTLCRSCAGESYWTAKA
jgi:formylmethanofuran dehydrogenase subunit E